MRAQLLKRCYDEKKNLLERTKREDTTEEYVNYGGSKIFLLKLYEKEERERKRKKSGQKELKNYKKALENLRKWKENNIRKNQKKILRNCEEKQLEKRKKSGLKK